MASFHGKRFTSCYQFVNVCYFHSNVHYMKSNDSISLLGKVGAQNQIYYVDPEAVAELCEQGFQRGRPGPNLAKLGAPLVSGVLRSIRKCA